MSEGEDEQRDLEPSVASERVGYGRPPITTRFRPGQCGNTRLRAAGSCLLRSRSRRTGGVLFLISWHFRCFERRRRSLGLWCKPHGPEPCGRTMSSPGLPDSASAHSGCSLFHNLSLAMICWLTVSKLRNQSWRSRDLVTGCVIGATMIACNVKRLCLGLEP